MMQFIKYKKQFNCTYTQHLDTTSNEMSQFLDIFSARYGNGGGFCNLTTHCIESCHVKNSSRQDIWERHNQPKNRHYLYSILLFKGLPLFGFLIFQFKNTPTPLCLSRDKIKGHSGKNAIVTPTKTLPKKQDYSPIIFQITLSTYKLDSFFKKKKKTYKLDSQNKNTGFFFAGKKKPHHTRVERVMRLVFIKKTINVYIFFLWDNKRIVALSKQVSERLFLFCRQYFSTSQIYIFTEISFSFIST